MDLLEFVNTNFVVGRPEGGQWSGVYLSPPRGGKIDQAGRLFALFSLKAPDEFDSKVAGDLLKEHMQDQFYNLKEKSIVKKLEKAILSTAKKLEFLLEREKIAAEEGIDLNISAIVLSKEFVYMAVLGDNQVLLLRNKSLINLTEGLKDLTGRSLVRTGSGKFNEEDIFLLVSQDIDLEVSEDDIRKAAFSKDFGQLKRKKNNSLFGILSVDLSKESDNENMEPSVSAVREDTEISDLSNETDGKLEEKISDKKEKEDVVTEMPKDEVLEEKKLAEDEKFKDEKSIQNESEEADDGKLKEIGNKVKDKLSDKTTYQVLWIKVKGILSKFFSFLKKYIWDGLLGMRKGGIFLRGAGPKTSTRGLIILIVMAILILVFSIRAIKKGSDNKEKEEEVRTIIASVEEQFSDGKSIGNSGNISEGVTILESALDELSRAKEYGVLTEEISQKETEGVDLLDEIRKAVIVTNENLVTDIAGYIEGANISDMELYNSTLYFTDAENSAIYMIEEDNTEVDILIEENTDVTSPESIVFDSEGKILISDSVNGIVKVDPQERSGSKLAGLSITSIGEVSEISNYTDPGGNDYLYLLRPSRGDITKISKYASGYSFPTVRLSNEKIRDSNDIEIDGKIYLSVKSDGVLRYYLDSLDPYSFVGLDKPFSDPSCIELDDMLLFIADKENKRIVVLTKGSYLTPNQGRLVSQFVYRGESDSFTDIREIVVDQNTRELYILDGSKVFKISLAETDKYASEIE